MKDEADKMREGKSQVIYLNHIKSLVTEVIENLLLWNEWASKNKSERDILDSLASFTEALNSFCKKL
jgi:ABC-type transport system involved in cytochrome c biogenesis ATPase subunit